MAEVGIGQWANRRSFQRWVKTQRPEGNGRGLCDVRTRYSRMVRCSRTVYILVEDWLRGLNVADPQ